MRNLCQSNILLKMSIILKNGNNAKCWRGCGVTITHTLLMWMRHGITILEKSLAVSQKMKQATTIQLSNCTHSHLSQWNENLRSHKKLYSKTYISFIHNSPKRVTTTQCLSVGNHKRSCDTSIPLLRNKNGLLIHATTKMNL